MFGLFVVKFQELRSPLQDDKWRGYGMLISQPPHTTKERATAALKVVCDALATLPDAHPIHVRIEKL
eukprot:Skav217991  [mRNA]  locus=scaffold3329:132759:133592:- [translate_table: standard]